MKYFRDKQGYEDKNRAWKISREERLAREEVFIFFTQML